MRILLVVHHSHMQIITGCRSQQVNECTSTSLQSCTPQEQAYLCLVLQYHYNQHAQCNKFTLLQCTWMGIPHLTISNLGIPVGIGCEYPPESRNASVALEGWVFGQGATQIPFYLICRQSARPQRLLNQRSIVTGVGCHVIHSACQRVQCTLLQNTSKRTFAQFSYNTHTSVHAANIQFCTLGLMVKLLKLRSKLHSTFIAHKTARNGL